jgi:hypothetical protein
VKTNPTKFGVISETVLTPARGFLDSARFQVVVEFAAGVCIPAVAAECAEEAVEAFVLQSPGCEDGEIALFDRAEQRVVASVRWAMETLENGLRVSHRKNVFQDWHLALIALEIQNRRTAQAEIKRSA